VKIDRKGDGEMRELAVKINGIEFLAGNDEECSPNNTVEVSLDINDIENDAYLFINNESYRITDIRKSKGLGEFGEILENIRYLYGNYKHNMTESTMTIIVNCGKTPPEFKVLVENEKSVILKESIYTITHEVQDQINSLIDSLDISSVQPAKYYLRKFAVVG
jgi:hypothetical protein